MTKRKKENPCIVFRRNRLGNVDNELAVSIVWFTDDSAISPSCGWVFKG